MPEVRLTKGGADNFVDALVKDPRKVPAVRTLVGFVGKAAEDKHIRIYADASLTSWVEVEAGDVLHTQALPDSESPLGATAVWVRRDAVLKSPANAFVAGGITAGNFGGAGIPNPEGDPLPTHITPIANGLAVVPAVRAAHYLRGGIAQANLGQADLSGLRIRTPTTPSLVDGCPSAMDPNCERVRWKTEILTPPPTTNSQAGGCPTTTYLVLDPGVLAQIEQVHVANLDKAYRDLAAWRATRALR